MPRRPKACEVASKSICFAQVHGANGADRLTNGSAEGPGTNVGAGSGMRSRTKDRL